MKYMSINKWNKESLEMFVGTALLALAFIFAILLFPLDSLLSDKLLMIGFWIVSVIVVFFICSFSKNEKKSIPCSTVIFSTKEKREVDGTCFQVNIEVIKLND